LSPARRLSRNRGEFVDNGRCQLSARYANGGSIPLKNSPVKALCRLLRLRDWDYHNQKNAGERPEPNGAVNGAMTGMGQSRTKRVCAEDVGSTPHKRTKTEAGQLEGRRGSSTASSPLTGTCRLSLTSSPVNFFRRLCRASRNARFSQRNAAVGGNKGAMRGNSPARAAEDHQIALTSLAPLEPRTTIEQGTHFEGESRPSEDPLSASPEVPTVEPQLRNGRLDAVNSADR
jgi:hypothetical protein